jgi:hypothetical protein
MPVCRSACRTNAGLNPAANTTGFFAQKAGLFRRPHNRFEPRFAHEKRTRRCFLMSQANTFGRAGRSVASAYWGFNGRSLCHRGGLTMLDKTHFCLTWGPNVSSCRAALTCSAVVPLVQP